MSEGRKYIILVGDGMGDYPIESLGGKTPLEVARTPNIDRLCLYGEIGLVRTIPDGMEPGSDVANMSLLGYDPVKCHTGRGPLEAASIGVKLGEADVAFRCNLVTVEERDGVRIMADYSAGHISTEEARKIVADLQGATADLPLRLYPGVSYRHLLVWNGGADDIGTTPPHDITGQPVEQYEKVYEETPILREFRQRAEEILRHHPVNLARLNKGERAATAVWPWGQGKAPRMETLRERCGIDGVMISAVDLLKGIGVYAGFETPDVPGATGYLDTNYEGKVETAIRILERVDLAYIHIEAPDETGHEGSLDKKIQAIEEFDTRVVGPVLEMSLRFPEVDVMVVTDHYTPISVRTHVSDPVPFLIVRDVSVRKRGGNPVSDSNRRFTEKNALLSNLKFDSGPELFDYFVRCSNERG